MDSILPSIARMRIGDHYCGIYRTDEDHRRLVVDYIRSGIERNERMLYIVNIQTAAQLRELLAAARIDVESMIASGQLLILTAKEAYLKGGEFDPDKMIAMLRHETDKALADGYSALRITGEMTWALAGDPGSERLVEYECKLNEFFQTHRCYAMCQYDRRRFDPELLLDILHTHPRVLHGTEGFDNERMYYIPSQALLAPERQSHILDRWLCNLSGQPVAGQG